MASLFLPFSEIYNLKHTSVGSADVQQKLQWSSYNTVDQKLLERSPNEISVRGIWFTETTFTIDKKINSKKWSCLLSWIKEKASSRKDTYMRMWTSSQGITVSAGVSRMGNTRHQSKQWTCSQTRLAACHSSNKTVVIITGLHSRTELHHTHQKYDQLSSVEC